MKNKQIATFGGGCFWCIEAVIQRLKGIEEVVSGYAGGTSKTPTYREVCNGDSGHAEVIQVTFDSEILSYEELLIIFMTNHNPTTLNYQGADYGTQYRSVIFYHNEEQKLIAEEVIKQLNPLFGNKIVTELGPMESFYPAEEYHQDYYNRNTYAGYCQAVITPKITKLKKMYADKIKESA
ncbi:MULTISPECIES: peptide-methionine (S)-S-oxide reductase MsrA [Flavobacterium]|jgi:peptide-methionine (S)-S-oxide reductase|uniref:peptide-methionine (S)-S-oxide reductase MsrA n=1 Tax=Flavobacterium TaxID=237 RepID=UPI000AE70EB3|nr:peptide-methionine (S)-S-oxide reductase MsrA [Flavobacterium johnsoniae]MBX9806516.1 peptide-methionine (S)-S-oxide reductase MsrA [Flavobacteriaceae bacterium]